MAEDPDSAKYGWQSEYKDMMTKKRGYTASLHKMFPTGLGCCDKDLQGKIQNRVDSDSLKSSRDTLGLLNAIEKEG